MTNLKHSQNDLNRGFTLVEIMLATLFVTLVFVVGYLFWNYFNDTYQFSFEEARIIDEAVWSVNQLTEDLREARDGIDGSYPLVTADDQELVFYSDVDNDGSTERVRYYLVGNELILQTFHPSITLGVYHCTGGCTICHQLDQGQETITIPESSWPAHASHGDKIGTCAEVMAGGGTGQGAEVDSERVIAEHVVNGANPLFTYYNGDWPGDVANNPLVPGERLINTRMVNMTLSVDIHPNFAAESYTLDRSIALRNLKSNL